MQKPITPLRFEENDNKRVDEDIWSPKFLSKAASRRSKTPTLKSRPMSRHGSRRCTTPTSLSISSYSSGRRSATKIAASSLKRIMSRNGSLASLPSKLNIFEPELTNHVSSLTKHADACVKTTRKPEYILAVSLSSNLSCRVIFQENEILKIEMKQGWGKGRKITFEGVGDEKPGYLPVDIVFLIDEIKQPLFRREGNDLEICVQIPLVDALIGCSISIPLLGGENMGLSFENNVIYPGYEKVIKGQGMPNPKNNGIKGLLKKKGNFHQCSIDVVFDSYNYYLLLKKLAS
ncbi:hypothetical protein JHK87_055872 [Glycine soja]|nr:hypothetical protein JHK87_055872 [Glycine soja]